MAMRPYPKGTGAGISLFILIALGIYAVSQVEEMKRTAFRDGFRCAARGDQLDAHFRQFLRTFNQAGLVGN